MSPSEVTLLVTEVGNLVSLPEVCTRVNEMVDDPSRTAEDIGKVISSDPALTARLLKIANSPFYGLSAEVDTVSRAITVLGTVQLRDLILASSSCQTFNGIPTDLISMEHFWHHSIFCGIAARKLANSCMLGRGEALFVAGLLHDVGQLAIFNRRPDRSRLVLLHAKNTKPVGLHISERQVLQFDHMEVGAELTRQWRLPPFLQECVGYHHDPRRAEQFPKEVAVVHIAQAIASLAENEEFDEKSIDDFVDEVAWEISGLSRDIVESTWKDIEQEMPEVQAMLME